MRRLEQREQFGSGDHERGRDRRATTETEAVVETESSAETDTSSDATAGLTGACKDLAEVSEKFGEALSSVGGGADESLAATSEAFAGFADQVPDEVQDDFQALADAFAVYAEALEGMDLKAGAVPTADQIAELTEAAKSFDDAKVTQASANIQAWVTQNCSTP